MLIACPACDATYQVPDHLVAAGRQMRCAKCGHDWHFTPQAPALLDVPPPAPPPAPPAPAPPPEPVQRPIAPVEPSPEPGRGLALPLAWVASVLLVAAGVTALFAFHVPLGRAWPPLLRLYGWVGL